MAIARQRSLEAWADRPRWFNEAWHRDDGLLLNLPVFDGCGLEFKRMVLKGVRSWELSFHGQETWYDEDIDQICTLQSLPPDVLPPLRRDLIGQAVDAGEYICRGGDYDTKMVLVLSGRVQKLVGDSANGGRCVVRELERGDCEGLTEFLGVGSEQRTCCLRGGEGGARVRFVAKESIQSLLKEEVQDEEGNTTRRWPQEVEYFAELALDRIDALNHQASAELVCFPGGGDGEEPLDLLRLKGQTLFTVDSGLGTSLSGPLPEGIEERYFLDGQEILKPERRGDCCILILRGEASGDVPFGCKGQCLQREWKAEEEGWLGDGRPPEAANQEDLAAAEDAKRAAEQAEKEKAELLEFRLKMGTMSPKQLMQLKIASEVAVVALVAPEKLRHAKRRLQAAADAGSLDLSDQLTSDWRWSVDDHRALDAIDILREAKLLSPMGEKRAEEVELKLRPPPPPRRPDAQSDLRSGSKIGQLALLGVPVVLGGAIRAKGPVLVAVLHRHVLLEALADLPERELFTRRGVTPKEWVKVLAKKKPRAEAERDPHLGPVTGPPVRDRAGVKSPEQALAGTIGAWRSEEGLYRSLAGADALEHVLLQALRNCNFIWDLISDAPHRLLEDLVREFEPRWLLPGEVVVVDEEPDCDFLFVVIHGSFMVTLEGEVIDHIGQGNVQGFSQILGLNDWTRTVVVSPDSNGESMIQVLKRESLERILQGHPGPKGHLRDIREQLAEAKEADWRMLQQVPAFCASATKPFLSRAHKDADVELFCPGDFLAEAGDDSASMMVIIAGVCRSEHPQTLFFVELKRGDWCFQNNILGIESTRAHDVVAVTHVMVLVLHRHAMLNAVVAYPDVGEAVLFNETWRHKGDVPTLSGLRAFEGVPEPCLARLEKEGHPRYYKKGSVILPQGGAIENDSLLFIVRGEVSVSVLGIEVRTLGPGDTIGLHRFLGLAAGPSQCAMVALSPCDILSVQQATLDSIFEDEVHEVGMQKLKNAQSVLGGGAILDAFGFPVGKKPAVNCTDCIEASSTFQVCDFVFVRQLPLLVEERAYWPGEKLYCQGDEGTFMFFIQAGRVELQVLGRKEHEEPDTGCTLGDLACLEQIPAHSETAVATTHVWARVLHRKLLRRALTSFPEEEKRLAGAPERGGGGLFED